MSIVAKLQVVFPNNKTAQDFSRWLYESDCTNKTLFHNTVTVTLSSHGDRVMVMEEARIRGGRIVKDDVEDDY